jgi:hypothetical protein
MHRLTAAIALGALALLGSPGARADNIWDVENARANARAGGPTSDYDKELLARYGCESGTNSSYCRSIRGGATTTGNSYSSTYRRARR